MTPASNARACIILVFIIFSPCQAKADCTSMYKAGIQSYNNGLYEISAGQLAAAYDACPYRQDIIWAQGHVSLALGKTALANKHFEEAIDHFYSAEYKYLVYSRERKHVDAQIARAKAAEARALNLLALEQENIANGYYCVLRDPFKPINDATFVPSSECRHFYSTPEAVNALLYRFNHVRFQ